MREGVRVHVMHYRLKCDKLKLLGKLVVQHSIRVLLGGGSSVWTSTLDGGKPFKVYSRKGRRDIIKL